MARSQLVRLAIKYGRQAWRHRRAIASTVATAGPYVRDGAVIVKDAAASVIEKVHFKKVCRLCEKHVIDNPLNPNNKWSIATRGERCGLCRLKVDGFGNPIPGSEKKKHETRRTRFICAT